MPVVHISLPCQARCCGGATALASSVHLVAAQLADILLCCWQQEVGCAAQQRQCDCQQYVACGSRMIECCKRSKGSGRYAPTSLGPIRGAEKDDCRQGSLVKHSECSAPASWNKSWPSQAWRCLDIMHRAAPGRHTRKQRKDHWGARTGAHDGGDRHADPDEVHRWHHRAARIIQRPPRIGCTW